MPNFYTCHPAMMNERTFDSLANIVQVWLPVQVKDELRVSEVGMLVTDSELEDDLRRLQQDIYTARCGMN